MIAEVFWLVGKRMVEIRVISGLSLRELALKARIQPVRLEQIEAGTLHASAGELYDLKTALGANLKDLYG